MSTSLKGTTPEIRPVTLETAIKRLRRFLSKINHQLVITRDGSKQRELYGQYFIRDEAGAVLADKINLVSWLRAYSLMADDEALADDVPEKWLTVSVPVVNQNALSVQCRFKVQARHFTKPVRDALRDAFATAGRCIERDADVLCFVLLGWKYVTSNEGAELPFTRDNVRIMLDNYPNSAKAIMTALLQEIAKGGTHDA